MAQDDVRLPLGDRFWKWIMAYYPTKTYADTPWTPLTKPLSGARVGLVTSCGVHLATDPPFDLSRKTGDPTFREIPGHVTPDQLAITHPHYDHSAALRDINCVFPIDRLRDLAAEGVIGSVSPRHYGFMGAISFPGPLIRETAPEVARRFKADAVDVVLLTPC